MLTLINTNRMNPPIGPIGLDYLADAARQAGIETEVLDLCLPAEPAAALRQYFQQRQPRLVGVTFRNVDDCYWASSRWFAGELATWVTSLRSLTDAPVVLGGVGYSMFPHALLQLTGADYGIHGDGEQAILRLHQELTGRERWHEVPGLLWRQDGRVVSNAPAWPHQLPQASPRDAVDNRAYFRRGGQGGFETKRGCPRQCLYCADPVAKGTEARLRTPPAIAGEVQALLRQGIDVLHTCDAEFNLPAEHALAVCQEFIRRRLGSRLRWYAYCAVVPFDDELAQALAAAGCVGINFTSDSASPAMLRHYRQPHQPADLTRAVRLCRQHGMAVMLDLLLGGPGETPDTLRQTIAFVRRLAPDCVGASLGVRVYPGTPLADDLAAAGPADRNPNVRRSYEGPLDLLRPTFYVSAALGPRPAQLIRELIAGDPRFFAPTDPTDARNGASAGSEHNYNENERLIQAVAAGRRGAYWDILRSLRAADPPNKQETP